MAGVLTLVHRNLFRSCFLTSSSVPGLAYIREKPIMFESASSSYSLSLASGSSTLLLKS